MTARTMIARARRLAVTAVAAAAMGAPACHRQALPSPEEGRALYLTNGCATCHGADGHGDGPIAKTLDPRPRDFRDADAFKNRATPVAIARTIAEGIPGGGAMPRFDHLTEWERESLALYISSLHEHSHTRKTQP